MMKSKITFLVLFAILLVSCTAAQTIVPTQETDLDSVKMATLWAYLAQDIDIGDGGLLSDQPCASPCAFGVRIGETRLNQVIPVLEKNGISRCWTEPNVSWSRISCGGNRLNVQVDMHTRLVNGIGFDPSVPISLGDMIEKYGEPNYMTIDENPDRTLLPRLYWSSIRMLVTLPEIASETYDIEKTTEVERISFSNEKLYGPSEIESDPYYKPWHGYRTYQPTNPFPKNVTAMPTVAITVTP